MGLEGFYASCSPSFEPLTHCPFTDSQCAGYILLLPALLFQLPGSHPSFFSPIGFSWCSHTSYGFILYFLLPISVMWLYHACWMPCESELPVEHPPIIDVVSGLADNRGG